MTTASTVNGDWDFDPAHTRIGFSARHAMITTVRGSFNDVSGHLHIDVDDVARSSARIVLQTASVDTRSAQRDEHLRSADFFDVEQWPEITFVSTEIEETNENEFAVTGDLTIRDVTKRLMVPIALVGAQVDAFGAERIGFEGTRRVHRRDYGLSWNMPLDAGGLLVSERITLEFEISAIRRSA